MNVRERMLMALLVAVVGGGALLFGVVFWFIKPLNSHNTAIAALNSDIESKQLEIDTFEMNRRKLVLARAKSLPLNAAEANIEYQEYLQRVLKVSGLAVEDISPSQASKLKFMPTVPGIKEVGHQMMTYTVRAKGELKSVVAALETMQATPFEHRIRTLSIDRGADMVRDSKDANPRLQVNMVIETLLVAKSDAKTGLPPGFDAKYVILDSLAAQGGAPSGWGMLGSLVAIKASMPVPESRSYYEIASKNIFTGPIPIIKVDPATLFKKTKKEEKEPEPEAVGPNALRHSYLNHTEPGQMTAYWRNRVSRSPEKKIMAKAQSGYDTFSVKDDLSDYIFLNAKVIRVDLRAVYFQKESKLYAWPIGTNLEDALENALDIDQRELLDLEIDAAYAKASTEKKDSSTKKTSTKGPTRGASRGGQ